ncbi:SlyX family protein [Marispirochaeta sp.]|jgi:SlyX protein|uniref:SlyX family protein n=1 Tax=Marispirochaeta sp. TaxID=2038653 RepID=UPI0029C66DAC|nr:SlyX family protein [Marispirochaeta sp.]
MDKGLLELQTKVSYQESVLADLNEAVISQQKEIDRLKKTVELLTVRIQDLRESGSEEMPHTPPPHY